MCGILGQGAKSAVLSWDLGPSGIEYCEVYWKRIFQTFKLMPTQRVYWRSHEESRLLAVSSFKGSYWSRSLNTAYPTELTDKSIPNNSFWILVLNLVQQPLPTLSLMHLPKHSPAFLLILQAPNRSPKPLIVSRSPDCCPTLASLQAVLTGTSISMALLGTSPYSCPVGKARQNRTTNLNPSPNPGLGSGGKTPSSPV